jgi:hypothetical protein
MIQEYKLIDREVAYIKPDESAISFGKKPARSSLDRFVK